MDERLLEESISCGKDVAEVSILQFSGSQFHHLCKSENSTLVDSTGLRIHPGAHVCIRFLLFYEEFYSGKSIVELGCGTGVCGLLGTARGCRMLTLTDGSVEAVALAQKNKDLLHPSEEKINISTLTWGKLDEVHELISTFGNGEYYDVVIGSELTYYRTIMEDLTNTVLYLTNHRGLFLHSHIFRSPGQEDDLIQNFGSQNWSTLHVPIEDFICSSELQMHPEWFNTTTLVSGPCDIIEEIRSKHTNWDVFTKAFLRDKEEEASDEESDAMRKLFS